MSQPWEWRKASGGWTLPSDTPKHRRFHAYDVNSHSACRPSAGLVASCEDVNEGSDLCPDCVVVVTANPAGRDRIDFAALRANR